jgi:hypothetical protein
VTLRHIMMMRRIDRACARMNSGLAAVAIVLGLTTGAVMAVRFAEFSVALASDVASTFDPATQRTMSGR